MPSRGWSKDKALRECMYHINPQLQLEKCPTFNCPVFIMGPGALNDLPHVNLMTILTFKIFRYGRLSLDKLCNLSKES